MEHETKNFVATMSGYAQEDVELTFNTTPGTATAGSDFTAQAATTVKIPKGTKTVDIPVNILGDAIAEPSEAFTGTIVLANDNGQQITVLPTAKTATTDILDNDVYTISLAGFTVTETNAGAPTSDFIATMNGLAQHDVVLTFSTADNSANATSDYLAQSTVSYTIVAGANNVHIPVGIVGNLMAEPTEDFKGTITMSNGNGQQVTVAGAMATSTINDNDVYTISLAGFTVTETNAGRTNI